MSALGSAGLGVYELSRCVLTPALPVWTWEEGLRVYKDGSVRVSPRTSFVCICVLIPLSYAAQLSLRVSVTAQW